MNDFPRARMEFFEKSLPTELRVSLEKHLPKDKILKLVVLQGIAVGFAEEPQDREIKLGAMWKRIKKSIPGAVGHELFFKGIFLGIELRRIIREKYPDLIVPPPKRTELFREEVKRYESVSKD